MRDPTTKPKFKARTKADEQKLADEVERRVTAERAKETRLRRQAEEDRVKAIVEATLKAARERAETEQKNRLVVWEELAGLGWRVGRRQTDRLEKVGLFPKRVVLGLDGGKVAWVRAEVEAHVEGKIAKRTPPLLGARRRQTQPEPA